jgi:hypothetical protein
VRVAASSEVAPRARQSASKKTGKGVEKTQRRSRKFVTKTTSFFSFIETLA